MEKFDILSIEKRGCYDVDTKWIDTGTWAKQNKAGFRTKAGTAIACQP